jgi:RNAse (barnase) inhibitor barstar
MNDWTGVFGSCLTSGIYTVTPGTDAGNIRKAAAAGGLHFLRVDLKGVKSKLDFLKKAARVLKFPGYFGMNWDAFSDCLTDMSWMPAPGYVLFFSNFQLFAENDPASVNVIRHIFDSTVEYWKHREVLFYIVLS